MICRFMVDTNGDLLYSMWNEMAVHLRISQLDKSELEKINKWHTNSQAFRISESVAFHNSWVIHLRASSRTNFVIKPNEILYYDL